MDEEEPKIRRWTCVLAGLWFVWTVTVAAASMYLSAIVSENAQPPGLYGVAVALSRVPVLAWVALAVAIPVGLVLKEYLAAPRGCRMVDTIATAVFCTFVVFTIVGLFIPLVQLLRAIAHTL